VSLHRQRCGTEDAGRRESPDHPSCSQNAEGMEPDDLLCSFNAPGFVCLVGWSIWFI